MDFAHLHVASAYSLRYGASMPDALVARAAEHGQRVLALTDRDGVYGAVRFVRACAQAGLDCVLGVDLALDRSHVDGVGDPCLRSPVLQTREPFGLPREPFGLP